MKNAIVSLMKTHGAAMTRESYIAWNWFDREQPYEADPEEEMMMPVRAAHSAEPETLAIPAADITFSIVRGSTLFGPLSLPEVPVMGSTFVEPASCKAELDIE